MPDDWIFGYKYFSNSTFPFDPLEPYSTIGALIVGVPTFVVAMYVYITLLRNPSFRGKAYFNIFIAQGFIDLIAFLTNLLRYRMALFEPFGRFYASLGDGVGATILCVLHLSMPRAQLVAQCLLSTNRLLAVFKPLHYDRWQSTFSRCGFFLLIAVPALVALPDAVNGFFAGALYGAHGTIIFYTTANRNWPAMMKTADYLSTGFQFTFTIIALICNCILIYVMATKKYSTKAAGTGLVVTTLAQFVTHAAYAIIMVCYLYFPPPLRNASMFTTIALDAISIVPIWLLLAFSSAVREAVMPSIDKRTVGADNGTVTMVVAAP